MKSKRLEERDEFAIEFSMFLNNNMYENMFEDLNNDGKTWASYCDDIFDYDLKKRFTIQELLEIFKKEKGYE